MSVSWVEPGWPAPGGVRALSTFRTGGVSEAPYESLNLGDHVGDAARSVTENRPSTTRSSAFSNVRCNSVNESGPSSAVRESSLASLRPTPSDDVSRSGGGSGRAGNEAG